MQKHPVEEKDSWAMYLERQGVDSHRRQLKHHHHHKESIEDLELAKEEEFWQEQDEKAYEAEKKRLKHKRKQEKRLKELWADPGIRHNTVHGLMIDAGSSGSRLHIYEWDARVLVDAEDVEETVSGMQTINVL